MNRTIRTLAAALLAALTLSAVSCGEAAPAAPATAQPSENAASETADAAAAGTTVLTDGLPDTDLDGRTVNLLVRSEFLYEFGVEKQTGNIINDAVYDRSLGVSERFRCDLAVTDVTGSWSTQDTFKKAIHDSVLAGDGAYDIVAGAGNYVMAMTAEGGFLDLTGVEHLDLTAPWWSQGFVENMKVGGKLYMASGDVALTSLENMCVVLFNKQLLADYALDDPYALVMDGAWTLDRLTGMASQVSKDVDGDGKFGFDDLYGFMTYNNMVRAMVQSFGLSYTSRGADGYPVIDFMSDRLVSACDKVTAFMKEDAALNYVSSLNDTLDIATGMQTVFSNAQVLFMTQVASSAQALRATEADFGILPYPKLDESQSDYRTTVLENVTAMGILVSVADPDVSGLILEALAFDGYDRITPAYYDVALTNMFTRDEESKGMLDIAREGRWFDFGYINSMSLEGINAIFATCALDDQPIASAYTQKESAIQASLRKLLDAYAALDD